MKSSNKVHKTNLSTDESENQGQVDSKPDSVYINDDNNTNSFDTADLLNDNIEVYDSIVRNYENNLSKYFQNISNKPSFNNHDETDYIIEDELIDDNLTDLDEETLALDDEHNFEEFLSETAYKSSDGDSENSIESIQNKADGANNSASYTSGLVNMDSKVINDQQNAEQLKSSDSDHIKSDDKTISNDEKVLNQQQVASQENIVRMADNSHQSQFGSGSTLQNKYSNIDSSLQPDAGIQNNDLVKPVDINTVNLQKDINSINAGDNNNTTIDMPTGAGDSVATDTADTKTIDATKEVDGYKETDKAKESNKSEVSKNPEMVREHKETQEEVNTDKPADIATMHRNSDNNAPEKIIDAQNASNDTSTIEVHSPRVFIQSDSPYIYEDGAAGIQGQFSVRLSEPAENDVVIKYSVRGSATEENDYVPLDGQVTIKAGESTATINLTAVDDGILENNETVIVQLDRIMNGNKQFIIGSNDSAQIKIIDTDSAEVSIAATDSLALENGNNGTFTVTLSKVADHDIVVNYTVTGDAVAGQDYKALSGQVTIEAGDTSAEIILKGLNDSVLEDNESVTVTLESVVSESGDNINISSNNASTVIISDTDTATVSVSQNTDVVNEGSGSVNSGEFTVSLSKVSDTDTVINYSVSGDATSGSDYTALSGQVTIAAGETSANIDIVALDDNILEDNESVTITLDSIASGDSDISIHNNNTGTIVISDTDTAEVSILATDTVAVDAPTLINNAEFTVNLSKSSSTDTVINYSVSGDATSGSDYTALSGEVTIAAGETSADINIVALHDNILEDNESVTITLDRIVSGDNEISIGSNNSSTVTITDTDMSEVTIVATDTLAIEGISGESSAEFTVSLSKASDTDTVINYSVSGDAISGSDYTALSGQVTIAAGETSAVISVSSLDDSVVELNESVTITLNDIASGDDNISIGSLNSDTVIISDLEAGSNMVSIVANDSSASETSLLFPNDGQFTVSLSDVSATDTVINYTISGTANNGVDFDQLSGQVTIEAGKVSANIDIDVLSDNIIEGTESVIVQLDSIESGSNQITIGGNNTAELNIIDEDTGFLSISSIDNSATEGSSDHAQFKVSLSSPSSTDTVVDYIVTGSATSGEDYTPLSGQVTISAGKTEALIDVTALDDSISESSESVTVSLTSVSSSNNGIIISLLGKSASIYIHDNSSNGVNTIMGSVDADNIDGTDNADLIYGLDGNDDINYGDGNDTVYGGLGDDIIKGSEGSTGDDSLYGQDGNDIIDGKGGDDYIEGGAGADDIKGGDGNDIVYGGDGIDTIDGGKGNDILHGNEGDDVILGDDDIDVLYGDDGDDVLYGGKGDDSVYSGTGNDELFGGDGNDTLYGEYGNNFIYGEDGNDVIYSGIDADKMYGGNGNDTFYEVKAGDEAYGEAQDDNFYYARSATAETNLTIDGGTGNDTLHLGDENNWTILFTDDTTLINNDGVISGTAMSEVMINNNTIDLGTNTVGAISMENEVISFTGIENITWQ